MLGAELEELFHGSGRLALGDTHATQGPEGGGELDPRPLEREQVLDLVRHRAEAVAQLVAKRAQLPRVPRAREIVVRAFDRNGERLEIRAADFSARVIQHETDHLDGVLFFDRMKSFESLSFLDEYGRYWVKDDD